jgi:hypothetical protein
MAVVTSLKDFRRQWDGRGGGFRDVFRGQGERGDREVWLQRFRRSNGLWGGDSIHKPDILAGWNINIVKYTP